VIFPLKYPALVHRFRSLLFPSIATLLCGMLGCQQEQSINDGQAIPLQIGNEGALFLGFGASATGADGVALLDTATPVNVFGTDTGSSAGRYDANLFGANGKALRGRYTDLSMLRGRLAASDLGPTRAVLGGEFWRDFSIEVELDASTPSIRIWTEQPATSAFLSQSGYTVLRSDKMGGGQLDTSDEPDTLGQRPPYQYPATRLMLRACAAPAPFLAADFLPERCCPGDEVKLATGADLALVIGTGYGPLVLSESAWSRVSAAQKIDPAASLGNTPLAHPMLKTPIPARQATIPLLDLVDREIDSSQDKGACVELGQARRLEQVAVTQFANSLLASCALPCDQEPGNRPRALNSAGYLELGGAIEVTIIADAEPLLQALRAEIRPEGPEVDGIIGAGTLKSVRFEIDYRSQPARFIASCLQSPTPGRTCRAVGRCPRLPGAGSSIACYGLQSYRLPQNCDNLKVTCE